MKTFDKYRNNEYSQNGEDGVIREIINRLDINKGQFVEFGAWDGKFLSNTFSLIRKGWTGVYIESDKVRYEDLLKTRNEFSKQIETQCCFVNWKGNNTLDNILKDKKISNDYDLLSIDIDTYDWQVWYSCKNYVPKIVVIEINSSVFPGVKQIHQPPDTIGSSFSSMLELGKSKGYSLVCHTGNMIFVRSDLTENLGLSDMEMQYPEVLFDYSWTKGNLKEENSSIIYKIKNKLINYKLRI